MIQILLLIFASVVVLEFGAHVIYHALTGKGGLHDPPFSYLKDIFKKQEKLTLAERIKRIYLSEDTPVMSELCRSFKNELSAAEMQELIQWAGDDEFVAVLPNKEIVCLEEF